MKFAIVNNHIIKFNEEDYIIVNGIQFDDITTFYPNIRSIKIHINKQEYDYSIIKEKCKNYLKSQYNVNMINRISNKINNKNWFECYINNEKTIILGPEQNKIEPELLNEKKEIIINKLYQTKTLLQNEFEYEHEFTVYPIWHINGNHKTKSKLCPLYCHYDIMLHIVSLQFVNIESQILRLATAEFLKSIVNEETIEEHIKQSHKELLKMIEYQKQIIKRKDREIFNLEECMRDIKKTNAHLESKIDQILENNKNIFIQLESTRFKLNETHKDLLDTRYELTQHIVHNTNLLVNLNHQLEINLNGKTIDNSDTNSICKIIIMAKFSKRKNIGIFINIRRQTTSEINQEINKYKNRNYRLIYENEVPNAMSVAKSIFNDEKNVKRYNIKKIPNTQSKYRTNYIDGKQLKNNLNEIIESYLNIPSDEICTIIREELEPINIQIEEIQDNILKLPEKLKDIKITAEEYYNLKGKFVKASNGYYKEVLENMNGILYVDLNKKYTEEIIRDDTTKIIYKNDKKDKTAKVLNL